MDTCRDFAFLLLCPSILKEDLKPFSNGITKELMMDTVRRGVGTHYQIIKHKLYREPECMFPARSVDISLFMLAFNDDGSIHVYNSMLSIHLFLFTFSNLNKKV